MAEYHVYLYNTATQAVTAEVPVSALSYSYRMDEAGTATFEVPMGYPTVAGPALTPEDLYPALTGVAIERNGELVWGGLLWAYRLDLAKRTISVSAQGYLSWAARRHTGVAGVTMSGIEQTEMVRRFLTNTITGILDLKTNLDGLVPTGMIRTRSWNQYEFKTLADVFADLADDITAVDPATGKAGGGFFLYWDPYWVTPGKALGNRVWNTTTRHPWDSGVALQQGVTAEIPEVTVDGTTLATTAYAVGATDGTASLTPYDTASNRTAEARMPRLNVILNETSIKQRTALRAKLLSALAFGAAPTVLPRVVTYPGLVSPLAVRPGALATVTTDDGFLNLIAAEYAVTESTVDVPADGSDRITLSLVQAGLFKETED
ncbi:hypothetical protein ACIP5N_27710 [Streptomyces sp. NPDC088768]|uniref:hypothetical protein n=1 Tax=Streptomyces sp. NPDC088768 TaxID=3365894 RepID=UPI0037F144B0